MFLPDLDRPQAPRPRAIFALPSSVLDETRDAAGSSAAKWSPQHLPLSTEGATPSPRIPVGHNATFWRELNHDAWGCGTADRKNPWLHKLLLHHASAAEYTKGNTAVHIPRYNDEYLTTRDMQEAPPSFRARKISVAPGFQEGEYIVDVALPYSF